MTLTDKQIAWDAAKAWRHAGRLFARDEAHPRDKDGKPLAKTPQGRAARRRRANGYGYENLARSRRTRDTNAQKRIDRADHARKQRQHNRRVRVTQHLLDTGVDAVCEDCQHTAGRHQVLQCLVLGCDCPCMQWQGLRVAIRPTEVAA